VTGIGVQSDLLTDANFASFLVGSLGSFRSTRQICWFESAAGNLGAWWPEPPTRCLALGCDPTGWFAD